MKQKKTPTLKVALLAGAGLSVLICLFVLFFSKTPEETGKEIQENFLSLEKRASQEAQKHIEQKSQSAVQKGERTIFIHQYENDSLTFWNTNKMPVPRLATPAHP